MGGITENVHEICLARRRALGVVIFLGFVLWLNRPTASAQSVPDGMVHVPAGSFIMGSNGAEAEADERPERMVHVDSFYIDRYEVTNAAYAELFPDHQFPPARAQYPVTNVTKAQAEAYCRAVGKRLPTRAEWEKAARGTDGRVYPWGNEFDAGKANISPYGVHDMCGNAWEWVADEYRSGGLLHRGVARGILKGGAHGYGAFHGRSSYNGFEGLKNTCNDTGFRCAR